MRIFACFIVSRRVAGRSAWCIMPGGRPVKVRAPTRSSVTPAARSGSATSGGIGTGRPACNRTTSASASLASSHSHVSARLARPADDGIEQRRDEREPHDVARHASARVADDRRRARRRAASVAAFEALHSVATRRSVIPTSAGSRSLRPSASTASSKRGQPVELLRRRVGERRDRGRRRLRRARRASERPRGSRTRRSARPSRRAPRGRARAGAPPARALRHRPRAALAGI